MQLDRGWPAGKILLGELVGNFNKSLSKEGEEKNNKKLLFDVGVDLKRGPAIRGLLLKRAALFTYYR